MPPSGQTENRVRDASPDDTHRNVRSTLTTLGYLLAVVLLVLVGLNAATFTLYAVGSAWYVGAALLGLLLLGVGVLVSKRLSSG
jgi:hypothetical protein